MAIDATTRVYCIIGNPVSHSMSPAIHNAAFAETGINSIYAAFAVTDVEGAVRGIRSLGIGGASVTIPHKVAVMPYLDRIDDVARMIGAVNTIVREGDKLVGYNTDGPGAASALKDAGIELAGRRAILIGSGGAARAVAFALAVREKVASIVILGVIEDEMRKLANELRKSSSSMIEAHILTDENLAAVIANSDILINASPVGMHPDEDKSPVPAGMLRRNLDVFDVVYNPLETRLIREARSAGCRAVPGVEMFIHQGALQFEMWTGGKAPISLMRRIVLERLGAK